MRSKRCHCCQKMHARRDFDGNEQCGYSASRSGCVAVRSITGLSGNEPNSLAENPERRDFTGNTENSLRSASSRLYLNFEQDEIDESRNIDNSEDVDFPATKLVYDWRAHAQHTISD